MPSDLPLRKLIICDFIDPMNDRKATLCLDGAIVLKRKSSGRYVIEKVGTRSSAERFIKGKKSVEVYDYSGMLALPGFRDMHFHWVQDDVREAPKDDLLKWLQNYTWPAEQKFKSKSYATKKAKFFSQKLLANGTIGGGCYGSLHEHSVDLGLKHFIGDFVLGNTLMTMNSPDYLCHSEEVALKGVKRLSKSHGKRYALTPRFAPTTHPQVMSEGAKIVNKKKSFIQSHLCETKNEIDYVLSLYSQIPGFEKVKTYTEIYKKSGVLGPRTIMGHGIHLDPSEWEIIKKTKTILAHCPTSNAPVKMRGLGSGLFDYRKATTKGVRWALGSDIGAGPYLSMFDVMESFVSQNKKNGATFTLALNRSTAEPAKLMECASSGRIKKDFDGDLIFVDSPRKRTGEDAESILKSLMKHSGSQRKHYTEMVTKTFWKGEEVFSV